jgi:hypothetical protein
MRRHYDAVAKAQRLTRAQRRERQSDVPVAGIYGVDVEDALADSWISRFVCFADSPEDARARIRDAGFHKRRIEAEWNPKVRPKEALPLGLGPDDDHWYRSRLDDVGWTSWEQLPANYRHKRLADLRP